MASAPSSSPPQARSDTLLPLTEMQQAYWVGRRGAALGGVAIWVFHEYDLPVVDVDRLSTALRRTLDRHDAARAVVTPEGSLRLLPEAGEIEIPVLDLRGLPAATAEAQLQLLRRTLSHRCPSGERGPTLDVRVTHLEDRSRIHLGFDGLFLDHAGQVLLMEDWRALYQDPEATLEPPSEPFATFLLEHQARRKTERYRRDRAYWEARLESLPPGPELPRARDPATLRVNRFARVVARLEPAAWTEVQAQGQARDLRPSNVVIAACFEALGGFAARPEFSLNLAIRNRAAREPRFRRTAGQFGGTTFLENRASSEVPLVDLARRGAAALEECLSHSSFEGIEVMRSRARRRSGAMDLEMPVVFTGRLGRDARRPHPVQEHWLGEHVFGLSTTPQVSLDIKARQFDGALELHADHVPALFPEGLIQEIASRVRDRLADLAEDEAGWDRSRDGWERRRARRMTPAAVGVTESRPAGEVRGSPAPLPGSELLHQGFLDQVRTRPGQQALVDGDRRFTYRDLAARAGSVAAWLQAHGAEPDSLVAVVMHRGWEQVVAVLGVLMAGAAYLPVDTELPAARRRALLARGRCRLALTQPGGDGAEELRDLERLAITPDAPEPGEPALPDPPASPDRLAYVVFTSGSTGEPKGVMIEHRAAANTIRDVNRRFHVGPADRVLGLSSLSFDLSVYDIFGTLAAGATLVLPTRERAGDPHHWYGLVREHDVSVWNSVPALAGMLVDDVRLGRRSLPGSLRLFLLSGDWIPLDLPARIREVSVAPELVSLGGATEASIWSISYPIGEVSPAWSSIPYGWPMEGQRWSVTREDGTPCPPWVTGELGIGGHGVARGYWDAPELTAHRFVVDPATGERWYRTGDLGRRLPDGCIELLGREDLQVKIRGYRVELPEIEAALGTHAEVRDVAVTVAGPRDGTRRLVAHVVRQPGSAVTGLVLRDALRAQLPDYMVPELVRFWDRLPLATNGKVERSALVAGGGDEDLPPDREDEPRERPAPPAVAPGEDRLETVAAAVREQLASTPLERDSNLLSCGANSIDIVQIVNRIEARTGIRLGLDAVYAAPTIAGIAREVERAAASRPAPSGEGARSGVAGAEEPGVPIRDPAERERFKARRLGVRRFPEGAHGLVLGHGQGAADLPARLRRRRSRRRFAPRPVRLEELEGLLAPLREIDDRGLRRIYASAGGLYPVQVYLHVREGRAERIAGSWYHDPSTHRLVGLRPDRALSELCFDRLINRPIFRSSAFALFLVLDRRAIEPLYGARARDYAWVEAGALCQILEEAAPGVGLGLCQVGEFRRGDVAELLELGAWHEPLHCLLGGPLVEGELDADRALAETLAEAQDTAAEDRLPPTPSQEALLARAEGGLLDPVHSLPVMVWLDGEIDPRRLQDGLDRLVASEPALRLGVDTRGDSPHPVVVPEARLELEVVDLSGSEAADPEAEAYGRACRSTRRPFDLTRPPLVRAELFQVGPDRALLSLVFSSFAADCFSVRIAVRRFGELTRGDGDAVRGRDGSTPSLQDLVAAWDRLRSGREAEDRFQARVRDLGSVPRLGAHVGSRLPGPRDIAPAEATLEVSEQVLARLRETARARGATLFMLLVTALGRCVSRAAALEEVVLWTLASVRLVAGGDEVVGPFSNPIPVRVPGTGGAQQRLERVSAELVAGYASQVVPAARLQAALALEDPAVELSVVLRASTEAGELALPGTRVREVAVPPVGVRVPVELTLTERADVLTGRLRFPPGGWEEELATGIAHQLPSELEQLAMELGGQSAVPSPAELPRSGAWGADAPLEELVCRVWTRVLGRPPEPDVRFFAAGGESLRATALASELGQQLGVAVPLAWIFRNPTPRELVESLLHDTEFPHEGRLVRLRAGRGSPVLVVPGRVPSPFKFMALALELPGERPVYCANLMALRSFEDSDARVEDFADDLLAELEGLDGWRGLSLIGNSFGGVLAHSLAQRLPRQWRELGRLAVINADTPTSLRDRRRAASRRQRVPLWRLRRVARRLRRWVRGASGRPPEDSRGETAFRVIERRFDRIHASYRMEPAVCPTTLILARDDRGRPDSLIASWREAVGDALELAWHDGRKRDALRARGRPEVVLHVARALGLRAPSGPR